jgi:hypothetical protein
MEAAALAGDFGAAGALFRCIGELLGSGADTVAAEDGAKGGA